jgi:hypothetical protein
MSTGGTVNIRFGGADGAICGGLAFTGAERRASDVQTMKAQAINPIAAAATRDMAAIIEAFDVSR